jgi:hypothetical protein
MQNAQPQIRLVRATHSPLGLYIRAARGDSHSIQTFLELRGAHFHGVVIDAGRTAADKALREAAAARRLDVVLDPRTQESALVGAFSDRLGSLPWGVGRPHVPSDFAGSAGKRKAAALAAFVKTHGFTKVLTPSHLIQNRTATWLPIDCEMASRLREELDAIDCKQIPIAYSLAIPYSAFRDPDEFGAIIDRVKGSVEDELWLKVEGFGSQASPVGIRNYVETVRALHHFEMPVIADHVGGLAGLSLVAFGGVGGLSHGVTLRESFNASHWMRLKEDKKANFAQHHRVYLADLDMHVKVAQARKLFDISLMRGKIGCKDIACCARGISDMLEQPGLHFLSQRMRQFAELSDVPEQMRPLVFLENFVRKASDRTMVVSNLKLDDEVFLARVKRQRRRLDTLRETLRVFAERKPPESFSARPQTRIVREATRGTSTSERRPGL